MHICMSFLYCFDLPLLFMLNILVFFSGRLLVGWCCPPHCWTGKVQPKKPKKAKLKQVKSTHGDMSTV